MAKFYKLDLEEAKTLCRPLLSFQWWKFIHPSQRERSRERKHRRRLGFIRYQEENEDRTVRTSRAADRARFRVGRGCSNRCRAADASGCGRIRSAQLRQQVERVTEQQNSSCTARATRRLCRVNVEAWNPSRWLHVGESSRQENNTHSNISDLWGFTGCVLVWCKPK